MTMVFSLEQVSKIYRAGFWRRSIKVLENINLSVAEGETVGFIGHNGAGKSSTIRLMLGLQLPTTGSALIGGKPAADPGARIGIAYLPEVPLLYDYMTPRELLQMSLHLHGYEGSNAVQVKTWLERMRVATVADKRVRGFSKGMSQRVALAMALCSKPRVLVLDEPLSGLDPIGRREVVDILEEYRQQGNTLFFSSHVLSDVERLADRFVFIHQGRIRASHSVDSVLRAASNFYEVTVCADSVVAGFEPVGRSLWRKSVASDDLATTISRVRTSGVLLHSVRSASNIEEIYLKLVGEASISKY